MHIAYCIVFELLLSGCNSIEKVPDSVYKKEKALVIYNEVIWNVSRDSKSYIAAYASWKDALTGKPKEFKRNLGYLPFGYKVATLDPGDYTLQKLYYPYHSYMYTFTANGAVSFSVQGGDIVYLGELVYIL